MIKKVVPYLVLILAALIALVYSRGSVNFLSDSPKTQDFDQNRAYQDVITQVNFGPRVPGSEAHAEVVSWIQETLSSAGWSAEIQELVFAGQTIKNVVGKLENQADDRPWVILLAHYDSRQVADHDPEVENRLQPVPGANDGASGVAVLLELARSIPKDMPARVWLLFVDAEDQGDLPGWDWILGSRAFVEDLTDYPDKVILLDMIGDKDLQIFIEKNSHIPLREEVWSIAARLGYEHVFINESKYSLIDDHIPFLMKGIPAIDIIDFDYPHYHTTADTPDKVSPESLGIVGHVITQWLLEQKP